MSKQVEQSRRDFLGMAAAGGLVLAGSGMWVPTAVAQEQEEEEGENITPPEDLMREHGVMERTLLVYEAGIARLKAGESFDMKALSGAASINREFVEDYHEKLEEEYVFPRFRDANRMVDLVEVLLSQHQAGRRVTDRILQLAEPATLQDEEARMKLVGALQSYITMYRPHAAREDTALFPKLKELVSSNEYDSLAETFEEKEHERFGESGFDGIVERVAQQEKALGIHELIQFTPSLENGE